MSMVCMPEWFSVIVRAVSGSECGMSVCSEGGASCTSQADQLGSHHSLAEQLESRNSLAEQLGSRSSLGAARRRRATRSVRRTRSVRGGPPALPGQLLTIFPHVKI
jgi:hypothetical protein